MSTKIIATVGLCGAGKSVISDYLEKQGFIKVYFGGITIEEIKKRGLEVNEKNERLVREELRKLYGMDAYAILSLSKIEKAIHEGKNVLIDGLYSFTEYKILKKQFSDSLLVIATFTPRKLRYERLCQRPNRPLTRKEAISRDFAEIDNIEKGGPIALADYTLINHSSVSYLIKGLTKILKQEKIV